MRTTLQCHCLGSYIDGGRVRGITIIKLRKLYWLSRKRGEGAASSCAMPASASVSYAYVCYCCCCCSRSDLRQQTKTSFLTNKRRETRIAKVASRIFFIGF